MSQKWTSPCEDAAKASLKCLEENPKDKSQCKDAVDFYKECKQQWVCDFVPYCLPAFDVSKLAAPFGSGPSCTTGNTIAVPSLTDLA